MAAGWKEEGQADSKSKVRLVERVFEIAARPNVLPFSEHKDAAD